MVLRKIPPGSYGEVPQSSSQSPRAIDGQLASLSATLRDVQDKVSRTPTDSKSYTDPTPSEASYPGSYHGEDPEVVNTYRDVPQDPPPAYDSSMNAIPKDERKKRWFSSLCFFFIALLMCIFLLVKQSALRSGDRYQHPITNPTSMSPTNPPSFDPSRSLIRHETSKSISGNYTLEDLIDFSTTSGSISITVHVSDDDIIHPNTSISPTLRLSSRSGSINLNFRSPRFSNAPLNHTVILSAKSGSITGQIAHGLSTTVSTESGGQNLNIFPSTLTADSQLVTTSRSGHQSIQMRDPQSGKLDKLHAIITTLGSASLNIRFPKSWEGSVHAAIAGSGNMDLRGRGLQVDEHSKKGEDGNPGEWLAL